MDLGLLRLDVLAPIGFVVAGAFFILLGEMWLRPSPRVAPLLALVAMASLMLAFYASGAVFYSGSAASFNPVRPMLLVDAFSSHLMALLSVGALLSVCLSMSYLPAHRINQSEYYCLLLLSVAGMFVLVSAVDLMTLVLGLELASWPLYVLAGFDGKRLRSNEAAIKFFLLGSVASAVLLYGVALLYGASGSTSYAAIRAAFDPESRLAMGGLALIVGALAFKIALVPFHSWAPDVLEGAPTSVTTLLSSIWVVAIVAALARFLWQALSAIPGDLQTVLVLMAGATMVVGNWMALLQRKLKRILAYGAVAQVGFLLVGLAASTADSLAALVFGLIVLVFMHLGAFGFVAALARGEQEITELDDLAGLAKQRPGLALVMSLFMFSLAGLPPTAGFASRFHLLRTAIDADLFSLALLSGAASLLSAFVYLRVPLVLYSKAEGKPDPGEPDLFAGATLALCAFAILALGVAWNAEAFPMYEHAREAAAALLP